MLRIGYVRLRDTRAGRHCEIEGGRMPRGPGGGSLRPAAGRFGGAVLDPRFHRRGRPAGGHPPGASGRIDQGALDAMDRLEERGASLHVIDPEITSLGLGGRALRAALQAVIAVEPAWANPRRRGQPATDEIRALQAAGVGPGRNQVLKR